MRVSRTVSSRPASRRMVLAGVLAGVLAVASLLAAAPAALASASSRPAAAKASAVYPSVKGSFGKKPSLTFPKVAAPTTLEQKVLHEGSGPVVKKGELIVTNYLGQIWRGKVFGDSWTSGGLLATGIGIGRMIPAWDDTIVGKRVGSRLLLVVPPADAYGASGQPSAGITGKDTIVFVVDLIAAYNSKIHGDPNATVVRKEYKGVKVSGSTGGVAKVTVTKSAPQPKKVSVTLIARGHGPKVTPGLVVGQYVIGVWSGSAPPSTWAQGTPDGEPVGSKSNANILTPLVGIPLGSRVLVELPKSSQGGPYALVFDLVAEPKA